MKKSIYPAVTISRMPAIATLLLLSIYGCTTPQLDPPSSITSDIASRIGAKPNWSDQVVDGAALHAAASLPVPNPLDEATAVAITINTSPDIARMIAETEAMRYEALDVSAPMNPMLNFATGIPLDSMGVVPIFAMLMVQIDELWKQPIRSASARDLYEAALLSLGAKAVTMASEVRSLWHEVGLRDEEYSWAMHDLELTDQLLAIARERFAVGESDGNAVAKAQAERVDAHQRSEVAQEMRATARLALMALMGRPMDTVEWTTGAPDATANHAIHGTLSSETAMIASLALSRLDVRAANARAKAAASKLQLAQRSRINQMQLGGGYDRAMQGDEGVGFALNVEIPIFNTGSWRIAKAQAEYRVAEIMAEKTRQTAIIELRSAWVKARAAENRHAALESDVLTPSIDIARRAKEAFEAGEGAERESIDAEHALNHVHLALTDLERERRTSRLGLSKAAGFLPAEEMP